ncbi:hypothetical protein DFH27DRAFT_576444 [Peziza echinospora]|nr:hypothetical protein DFH27DRAFT_576444 [Peziza echinospora]
MGGGAKIPYPHHVWSPTGGWYSRPSNWKSNTAIIGATILGTVALVWNLSANREYRAAMPPRDRFFPSRYWSKQIKEHERREDEASGSKSA